MADPTRVKAAIPAKKEEQKEGAAAADDLEARLAALKM